MHGHAESHSHNTEEVFCKLPMTANNKIKTNKNLKKIHSCIHPLIHIFIICSKIHKVYLDLVPDFCEAYSLMGQLSI